MPGVPPNALGKLKGMLKGMLKGGSKKKQSGQDQRTNTSSANTAVTPAQASKPVTSAPAASPDTSKTLPPTNAPGSAAQTQPTSATSSAPAVVGAAGAAGVGAGGLATTGTQPSALGTNDGTSEERPAVSPAEPPTGVADEAGRSEPVSAIESEEKPLPPPKNDIVAEDVRSAPPIAPAAEASPVTHQTQTAQRLNPAFAPIDDENARPNGIAPVSSEIPPDLTESTPQATSAKPDILDEKMPVMAEEPPEVKPVAAKPGMSATSGPLEDFPEGGAEKDETLRYRHDSALSENATAEMKRTESDGNAYGMEDNTHFYLL
ncbi:hypothetical protein B0A48_05456 [Cryoendolithus antarcticus]|uniref:Uncharacterized protein n=1 Tax=Cryoendolithus antarcticus TaxID=1507870 RepID=A0A1V8TIK6_9PEZI|nr:hypothetical protein B0A48_05456 [Cryoendolithus antarcticus]